MALMLKGLGFRFAEPIAVWSNATTNASQLLTMLFKTMRILAYARVKVGLAPLRP